LDVLSGLGHNPVRKSGSGPRYLVTDLGQFDFGDGNPPEKPHLRLVSYHPGVKIQRIQARTGFKIDIAPGVCETPIPTPQELKLLREEIDPQGIRRLESLSGAPRRQLLREIIADEASQEMH
jgi:hypothetical protein